MNQPNDSADGSNASHCSSAYWWGELEAAFTRDLIRDLLERQVIDEIDEYGKAALRHKQTPSEILPPNNF